MNKAINDSSAVISEQVDALRKEPLPQKKMRLTG